jgi:hypothetical protein
MKAKSRISGPFLNKLSSSSVLYDDSCKNLLTFESNDKNEISGF